MSEIPLNGITQDIVPSLQGSLRYRVCFLISFYNGSSRKHKPMPFTFSHPAIVLPLTFLRRQWFSLTGLAVGSLTRDVKYF